MTTPTLGTKGAALNLLVRQGATYGPQNMLIKGSDSLPIDVTGYTFRGQVRKESDSATVAASITFVVNNAANGDVSWSIAATATASLTCDPDDETVEASQYVYDIEMESGAGVVTPLLYGTVSVYREVTK